jgi:hypothetical protein
MATQSISRASALDTGRFAFMNACKLDGTCRPIRNRAAFGLAALTCAFACACGGNGASVRGTVSFKDQPVNGGRIFFLPDGDPAGRPTVHGVIEQGRYDVPAAKGLKAGRHRVEIVWHQTPPGKQPPAEPGLVTDDMVQIIPAAYNSQTTLFVDVQRGANNFDFALKERP